MRTSSFHVIPLRSILCFFLLLGSGLGATPSPTPIPDAQITKQLLPVLSRLRGLSLKNEVPVGRKNSKEVEAYIRKRLVEEYPADEIELERKALVHLGLIPPTFEYEKFIVGLLRDQVAGFYDPEEKKMFLSETIDPMARESVLIHELTHALQDQHFNLLPMMKRKEGNDDQTNAINALIEGDAFAVMMDFSSGGVTGGKLPNFRENLRQLLSQEQKQKPELKDAPPFLLESLVFPYVDGMNFVDEVRAKKKWEGVNSAFGSPPASSEEILHPEKYLSKSDPPKEIDSAWVSSHLGKGMRIRSTNVLGEFGVRMVLSDRAPASEATKGAEGWGGDRYWLLETSPEGKTGLLLATVWDSTKDADEFEKAWKKSDEKSPGTLYRKKEKILIALDLPADTSKTFRDSWFNAQ